MAYHYRGAPCAGDNKSLSTVCSFVTQHDATDTVSQDLRERAIGMLTAGMSTRTVAREFKVNFSTISHLKHCFRAFGSTLNRPPKRFTDVNVVGLGYGQAKAMENEHNCILSITI